MNVDKVAAMQGIGDLRLQIDPGLCNSVCRLMSRLSKPGAIKRAEFDLSEFLAGLAQLDFSEYAPSDVATLFQQVGESLKSGIWVADHGFNKVIQRDSLFSCRSDHRKLICRQQEKT